MKSRKNILGSALIMLLLQAAAVQAATGVANIAGGDDYSLRPLKNSCSGGLRPPRHSKMPKIRRSQATATTLEPEFFRGPGLFLQFNGGLWSAGLNKSGRHGARLHIANPPEQIASSLFALIKNETGRDQFLSSSTRVRAIEKNPEADFRDEVSHYVAVFTEPAQICGGGTATTGFESIHRKFLRSRPPRAPPLAFSAPVFCMDVNRANRSACFQTLGTRLIAASKTAIVVSDTFLLPPHPASSPDFRLVSALNEKFVGSQNRRNQFRR